jgi:hypothetical protein
MKKLIIIFNAFAILFTACKTDFDVNAEWEETTVVYGILDASKDTQYVKISKAFLGDTSALAMAQYEDSINFGIDELDVKIYKWGFNTITDSIVLTAVPTTRDSGIFNENIVVYEFLNNNYFLENGYVYELVVFNLKSGNKVSSSTELVQSFGFDNMANNFKFYKPFNPDSTKFTLETVRWSDAKNATIYQLIVRINYTEDNDTLYLDWIQPLESSENLTILEGRKFFSFLESSNQLEVSTVNIVRSFQNIDLYLTAGTSDLYTYIQVNEPITGIVQQRPYFTNINNGIGLFTSRYSLEKLGQLQLSDDTKEYVSEKLGLNFE